MNTRGAREKAMNPVCLHDKREIEAFLRRDVFLHIYSLGDLDDFFWPHTTWYALKDNDGTQALVLIYSGGSIPALLALSENDKIPALQKLLRRLIPVLPRCFYAHLSPRVQVALQDHYTLISHGEHYKMGLSDKSAVFCADTSSVVRLSSEDLPEIVALLNAAYPGNWFEPRMLEMDQYYGIRRPEGLVSMGGVHVYSPRYRVAALGNIATHPKCRGRGYATAVTAKLCQSLLREVDHIGLNVKVDNTNATRCYQKLGFDTVASYTEYTVEQK